MRKTVPLEAQGPKGTRQAMWEALRQHHQTGQTITAPAIYKSMPEGTPPGRVRDYLTGLEKGGYLARLDAPRKSGQPVPYTLVKDIGVEAPRVRRDGTTPTSGQGREHMWRTLKILGEFSARQLASAASTPAVSVAERTAGEYCRFLKAAGYLQLSRKGGPGSAERYRLIASAWSGPQAPMIQRTKQLYDPNTGQVVYTRIIGTDGGQA